MDTTDGVVSVIKKYNFKYLPLATCKGRTAIKISTKAIVEEILIKNCPRNFRLVFAKCNGTEELSEVQTISVSNDGKLLFAEDSPSIKTIRDCAKGIQNNHLSDEQNSKTLNFYRLENLWLLFDACISEEIVNEMEMYITSLNVYRTTAGVGEWVFYN